MKLASFIILSTALHGTALVLPISFHFLQGETNGHAIPVVLVEAGGPSGQSGVDRDTVRQPASRIAARRKMVDERITRPAQISAPAAAPKPAAEATTESGEIIFTLPPDSYSLASAETAAGEVGIGENGGNGTGQAAEGSGTGNARSGYGNGGGIGNGGGRYRQARTHDAPKPKYPDSARRDGKEGRVLLRVLVNEEGRTTSVEVNRSSGVESLDQAALEAIKRWRFSPARLGERPVKSWVRIPIDFRLTDTRE